MPDSILTALKTKWNATGSLLSLCGNLYANEVPERDPQGNPVSVPYTYCEVGRTRFTWTTESLYFEQTDIEFNTFTLGANLAEEALQEVRDQFDWESLPFTAAHTVRVEPVDELITSENLRYKDGTLIWRAQVCYQVVVERRLTNQPS